MSNLVLTFPSTLRYACEIEACQGCCSLFEDIGLSTDDIRALESLGYSSFYRGEKNPCLCRPCVFLKGKLCEIHINHGISAKPSACRKYPFSISFLDNGWTVVDVKWACRGVGLEGGEELSMEYVTKELYDMLKPGDERIPVGNSIALTDEGNKMVSWEGVKEFYDFAFEEILFKNAMLRKKIGELVYLFRELMDTGTEGKVASKGEIIDILRSVRIKPLETAEASLDSEINYYGIIDELLSIGKPPGRVAKKLGMDLKVTSPGDPVLTRDAEKLYSLYLSQCLKETLSKPWSLRACFYWSMGVMGLVDFITRCTCGEEVGRTDIRRAIAVVDFMNKGYREFRDYAYTRYPDLGFSYLNLILGSR